MVGALLLMHACSSSRGDDWRSRQSDTLFIDRLVVTPPDTVVVDRIRATVRYVPYAVLDENGDTVRLVDTVFRVAPYVASVDTVIGCSEIRLQYRFPEHRFDSLYVKTCPDTVTVRDAIVTQYAGNTFWEDVGLVAAGAAGALVVVAGIILGTN